MAVANGVERTRVMVVDDHPLVHFGLRSLFDADGSIEVVGEAYTSESALEQVGELAPDVAIVDLSLGRHNGSGLELIKELRERRPGTRVLVLSMHDESLYAERVLRAGARGYITKRNAVKELVSAVKRVLSGEIYLSDKMSGRLVQKLVGAPGEHTTSLLHSLSDRELEVYEMIGQGISARQIAESLGVSVKTIETHRARIKGKLNLGSTHELVRHAIHWVTVERESGGASEEDVMS